MCGVFGLSSTYETYEQAWWKKRLDIVNTVQKHRGPDEQNQHTDPNGRWGVAHQRLSILDLSVNGRQPMDSASKNSCIVYNGEIYNSDKLKSILAPRAYRGHSDTEVLLEGLEQKGPDFISSLDGMFAFGFLDHRKNEWLLAVDPAGKKPLYTYWDGKIFAFASEIKTFSAFENLHLEIDPTAVTEYLLYGYVPSPRTIYKNVRRLLAGHYQIVPLNKAPQKPIAYWDLSLSPRSLKISKPEARTQVRELIQNAVKKRFRSDVPVGAFLSGGLDSSIVCLEASEFLKPNHLHTFSIAFNESGVPAKYDESPYARFVAKKISSSHTEIPVAMKDLEIQKIIQHFGEPFADSSALPTYVLSQATAQHVKVALSGDGGDEVFGGYLRFRAGLISRDIGWMISPFLNMLPTANAPRQSWKGFVNRFRERLGETALVQQLCWNSFFQAEDFKQYLGNHLESLYEKARNYEKLTQNLDLGQKILYYNFKTYLFDDLLPKVDRMSMAHGLEIRCPFLDKELIEFVWQLPSRWKFDEFKTKKLLKDIYRTDFGSDFVDRRKQGFAIPIEHFAETHRQEVTQASIKKLVPELKISDANIDSWISSGQAHYFYLLLSLRLNMEKRI